MILTPATSADHAFLLHVRNNPYTREMSFRPNEVGIEDIIGRGETYVALIRYPSGRYSDIVGYCQAERAIPNQIELSWYTAPEHRYKGHGLEMVKELVGLTQSTVALVCAIKCTNPASLKIAERNGAKFVIQHNGVRVYRWG